MCALKLLANLCLDFGDQEQQAQATPNYKENLQIVNCTLAMNLH